MSPARLLLVHGAFHGACCWERLIAALHERGVEADAVDLPLTALGHDAEVVADAMSRVDAPLVVVGHSYGGAVITAGAAGGTNGRPADHLVYLAALMQDPAEDVDLAPTPGMSAVQLSDDGAALHRARGAAGLLRMGGRRRGAPVAIHRLGDIGVIGINIPEEYGGGGSRDYAFNVVIQEEMAAAAVTLGTLRTHMDVVVPYFLAYASEDQRRRWFPGLVTGELYTAIALTEPDTGSDLAGVRTSAVRDGDEYVLNGTKTFITGGLLADLVIVLARTSTDEGNRRTG